MMKQTSQNGKNVKFEQLGVKNDEEAFEINCSLYFFVLCSGSKFESINYFISVAAVGKELYYNGLSFHI